MARLENNPARCTKKRTLKQLSAYDIADIIFTNQQKHITQKDVAQIFNVHPSLVCKLMGEHWNDPFYISKQLAIEKAADEKDDIIR